jgi:X-X-X-Leu-X-X-Gly heptad repeat protein
MPDGSGVNNGVGKLDDGLGTLSGIIEYTMIRAKDAYQI